jgi:hypothetical protein
MFASVPFDLYRTIRPPEVEPMVHGMPKKCAAFADDDVRIPLFKTLQNVFVPVEQLPLSNDGYGALHTPLVYHEGQFARCVAPGNEIAYFCFRLPANTDVSVFGLAITCNLSGEYSLVAQREVHQIPGYIAGSKHSMVDERAVTAFELCGMLLKTVLLPGRVHNPANHSVAQGVRIAVKHASDLASEHIDCVNNVVAHMTANNYALDKCDKTVLRELLDLWTEMDFNYDECDIVSAAQQAISALDPDQ